MARLGKMTDRRFPLNLQEGCYIISFKSPLLLVFIVLITSNGYWQCFFVCLF